MGINGSNPHGKFRLINGSNPHGYFSAISLLKYTNDSMPLANISVLRHVKDWLLQSSNDGKTQGYGFYLLLMVVFHRYNW